MARCREDDGKVQGRRRVRCWGTGWQGSAEEDGKVQGKRMARCRGSK